MKKYLGEHQQSHEALGDTLDLVRTMKAMAASKGTTLLQLLEMVKTLPFHAA
jgi:hypothetical protein